MADKIKKFFAKKKMEARFKMAGPGHRLTETSSVKSQGSARPQVVRSQDDVCEESRVAAEAALARLGQRRENPAFNTSLAAIQAQVRKELESEREGRAVTSETAASPPAERQADAPQNLAVTGVYFKCPMISNDVLPRDEWKTKMKEFLYEQLEEERGLTACLIIHSCNSNREKVEACVSTLCKYLENIIAHPDEDKYRKIRMSNRAFCDRVQSVEGSMELLHAAGFEQRTLAAPDGTEEPYLVFSGENAPTADSLTVLMDALRTAEPIQLELDRNLQVLLPSQALAHRQLPPAFYTIVLMDALRTAEPIQLELDRNLQVLLPSQALAHRQLPPAFYTITPEEIKREQQNRVEAIERSQMLRTKAMREKEELREMKKYRFALLRIRFPDGILLQGTFSVYERYADVHAFVQESLEHSGLPFLLTAPTGHKLHPEQDAAKTLVELRLVPTSVLTFAWDPSVLDQVNTSPNRDVYLKPEVMVLVREI